MIIVYSAAFFGLHTPNGKNDSIEVNVVQVMTLRMNVAGNVSIIIFVTETF
jgi:hypothetical protein